MEALELSRQKADGRAIDAATMHVAAARLKVALQSALMRRQQPPESTTAGLGETNSNDGAAKKTPDEAVAAEMAVLKEAVAEARASARESEQAAKELETEKNFLLECKNQAEERLKQGRKQLDRVGELDSQVSHLKDELQQALLSKDCLVALCNQLKHTQDAVRQNHNALAERLAQLEGALSEASETARSGENLLQSQRARNDDLTQRNARNQQALNALRAENSNLQARRSRLETEVEQSRAREKAMTDRADEALKEAEQARSDASGLVACLARCREAAAKDQKVIEACQEALSNDKSEFLSLSLQLENAASKHQEGLAAVEASAEEEARKHREVEEGLRERLRELEAQLELQKNAQNSQSKAAESAMALQSAHSAAAAATKVQESGGGGDGGGCQQAGGSGGEGESGNSQPARSGENASAQAEKMDSVEDSNAAHRGESDQDKTKQAATCGPGASGNNTVDLSLEGCSIRDTAAGGQEREARNATATSGSKRQLPSVSSAGDSRRSASPPPSSKLRKSENGSRTHDYSVSDATRAGRAAAASGFGTVEQSQSELTASSNVSQGLPRSSSASNAPTSQRSESLADYRQSSINQGRSGRGGGNSGSGSGGSGGGGITSQAATTAAAAASVVPGVCRVCRDLPFGLMLVCAECGSELHSGCVSAKERIGALGSRFVCSACKH